MPPNKVDAEREARRGTIGTMSTTANSQQAGETPAAKAALETQLTVDGYVARVKTLLGTYAKVQWFKNGMPFTAFKSKNFVLQDAKNFLSTMRSSYETGFVPVTSVTLAPPTASKSKASAFTQQFTATVLPANATNATVVYSIPTTTGVTINSSTGLLSGTTAAPLGTVTVTATVVNSGQTATSVLTVTA